jgi:hypothetical protein
MTQLSKWLFAGLAALVLAAPLMTAAAARAEGLFPADPHGGVRTPGPRFWTTYEVHVHYTRRATGQTWDVGYTFNWFRDGFGNVVRTDGWNEFLNGIAAENAQGWDNDPWQSYPIASGTW